MLIIGRNMGQSIVINGNITVKVLRIRGALKLAVDAPKDVTIERGEAVGHAQPKS